MCQYVKDGSDIFRFWKSFELIISHDYDSLIIFERFSSKYFESNDTIEDQQHNNHNRNYSISAQVTKPG